MALPNCAPCLRHSPIQSLKTVSQCRHATLLRRPKRPYTFTQLVTLSDGSSFLQRTTSPVAVYKSTKDARNNPLWNPSLTKLLNIEEDEAGRLRKFRERFGRGWDAESSEEMNGETVKEGQETTGYQTADESLLDLISGYGKEATAKGEAHGLNEKPKTGKKGKGSK